MKAKRRERITPASVRSYAPPQAGYYLIYDQDVRRLAVAVHASGKKAWKFIYHHRGKTRWLTLGEMSVNEARRIGYELSDLVAKGKDPQADAMEAKRAGSFDELVERYFAETNNRSADQYKYLLKKYVPPRFNSAKVTEVSKADVKAVLGPLQSKTPALARQVLAAMSSVFQWGIEALVIQSNPCRQIKTSKPVKRERILSNEELKKFYLAFDDHGIAGTALKVLLLTGQRPGEVAAMNHSQIKDGWWEMKGEPEGLWPGTKNKCNHRVWLPRVVRDLIELSGQGQVFTDNPRQLHSKMQGTMTAICKSLGVERATPHDLRRTHGSTITRLLGFGGVAAMNRIQNHREGGIAGVYDRYGYEQETRDVMEMVAREIIKIARGPQPFDPADRFSDISPQDLETPDIQ
jgi:integrase